VGTEEKGWDSQKINIEYETPQGLVQEQVYSTKQWFAILFTRCSFFVMPNAKTLVLTAKKGKWKNID